MKTWLSRVGSQKSFQIAHWLTEFVALFLGLFRLILPYCFIFVFLPLEQFCILALLCISVISSNLSNLLKIVNNYSPRACNVTCQFPKQLMPRL